MSGKGSEAARRRRPQERARVRRWLFLCILALTGVVLYGLNLHTPLMMDDYDYSFSWKTGQPLAGIADVLASQAEHYRLWGGRSVTHTLAQLFLFWGKPVFNAANTAMYLLFLLEIYALGRGGKRPWDWEALGLEAAFLFFGVPFFGTVFLWLDGACNYLWGTALALVPLLVDRSESEGGFFSGRKARAVWAVPLCFAAGWTNENTACAVWALVLLRLLWRKAQGEAVPRWRWAALAAQALGVIVMLAAPGNFARASAEAQRGLIAELLYRFAVAGAYSLLYAGVPLAAMAALGAYAVRRRAALRPWALWLLLGAVLVSLALVGSPVISDRSFTGTVALALAAALSLLADVREQVRLPGAARMAALAALLLLLGAGGARAIGEVKAHEAAWLAQTARAEQARLAGEESVTLESIPSRSRFTLEIALGRTPEDWPNSTLSRALGIRVFAE